MSEQEVSVKLTAKDETAHAYESAEKRIEKFTKLMESGGGEKLVKGLAGGAVAIAALEGIAKGAEIASTFLHKYTEELEHAGNAAERDNASFMALNETFKEHVPILGHVVAAVEEAGDAWKDYHAVQLIEEGASEEQINRARSREGFQRYALQTLQETKSAYQQQSAALNELAVAKDRDAGATEEHMAAQAVALAQLTKNAAAKMAIDDYERQHPNRTPAQNNVLDMQKEAMKNSIEAGQHEISAIHDRFRKQRADEDRDEIKRHQSESFAAAKQAADDEAEAWAQKLRMAHKGAEADLLLRRRQHEDEIAESRRAENEALADALQAEAKKSKARGFYDQAGADREQQRIAREAEAHRKGIDLRFRADEAKIKQDADNSAQDEHEERRHTVAALRLDLLKEESSMGSQVAKTAAEVLGIQEKFNTKRAELNRLLREAKDLPDEERKKLLALLPAYDALQKAEIAKMKMGQIGAPTSPFSQQSEMGEGNTGMREAFGAGVRSMEDRQLELQQKIVDSIIQQSTLIADISASVGDLVNSVSGSAGLN